MPVSIHFSRRGYLVRKSFHLTMQISIRFSKQGNLVSRQGDMERNSFNLTCKSVFASVGKARSRQGKKFISFDMQVSMHFSGQGGLVKN